MTNANILEPLPAERFDYWHALHLLNRAGFGGTPTHIHHLAQIGLDATVHFLVDFEHRRFTEVHADDFDSELLRPATREELERIRRARDRGDTATIEQIRRDRLRRSRLNRTQMVDFQRWWVTRMMETPRPLEEKMTLFWHGHFATSFRGIQDSYHMFLQNRLFRMHAAGSFRDLTQGIVHDPAMLRYLNNNQNRKEKPNENLARELLELFTLGEGSGYTEQDIREGARSLTGYTYKDDDFYLDERRHDEGPKEIFGRTGNWTGDEFVDLIFRERSAAAFICAKLYRFFVNDLPYGPDGQAQAAIVEMTRVLENSDYRLGPLLHKLFKSAHFYASTNVNAQIKSPVQLIVQTRRSLETPIRHLDSLIAASRLTGQDLGYPPSVKGWVGGRAWINTATMFMRQNLLLYMLTGRASRAHGWSSDATPYNAAGLVAHLEEALGRSGPKEVATYLLQVSLGRLVQPERIDTLERYFAVRGGRLDNETIVGALSLVAVMPEYQLC